MDEQPELQTENVHLIGHFNVKQNIHSRTICNLDNVSLLHEMLGRTNRLLEDE
jgi:hypothetical protein